MNIDVWRVVLTRTELPTVTQQPPFVNALLDGRVDWLRQERLTDGTPYLLSPTFRYDVDLNDFFRSAVMAQRAPLTQQGYARDLAAFLSFLWSARGRRSWRDASEADHLAYLVWRRQDPAGPRVSGATWDREVAAVNQFYRWALQAGHVQAHPIPQTSRRPLPAGAGWAGSRTLDEQRPATYSHDGVRDRVAWLPPAAYRAWRDVGLRGYGPDGLPRPGFRGRWATRNALFSDLMVRTGLRLQEQSALTTFEVPPGGGAASGYRRFWLPAAIAKGASARWVYVPGGVLGDLHEYLTIDRAAVVAEAQADGRYWRVRRPLVVEDPARPVVARAGVARSVDVARLGPGERRRLLVEGECGLEPAALWLGEQGWPITMSRWKGVFAEGNDRCRAAGLAAHCHPHMLRHSFAVVTLEQLQRGHLAALGELTAAQRGQYTRIFGDPLDWVRRRLGHRSVVTTQIYLHALAELEMETRTALVPDGWEDPREPAVLGMAGQDEASW
ncbi:tyrosine-type recombinase/integrase [Amycolatopsis tolypomycina]|uniref:tyrosine-type recombinase/integrase n=1 Tax=Amycolatopsis tolypomycina TaxID=208445 RepID=UPI000B83EC74|nr:site-specific integrase [Amycolatopsis tolypomycina]